MIPISTINPAIPIPVAVALKALARRSVDGSVQTACKHVAGNTADSSAVDDTNTEENFTTNVTIPSTFFRVGSLIKIIASGVYSTTGTPTLVFKFILNATTILTFSARTCINNASNQSWEIETYFIVRTLGSSGTVMGWGTSKIATSAGISTVESVVNNASVSISTLSNQIARISLTWSAASASNTATCKNFLLFLSDY